MRTTTALLVIGLLLPSPLVSARAERIGGPVSSSATQMPPREAAPRAGTPGCSGASVRFARDVEPILMSGCGGEYCHGSHFSTPARAYRALVGESSTECEGRVLVVPGHPEASYVIEKVTQREVCAGAPMPRGIGNALRPAEVQTLYDWICEGAPED